jgi:polyisoprenoid-binding protein YceI
MHGLHGKILFDPLHLADTAFDVSIDAETVDTGNNLRDNRLRSSRYLDVEHYPHIRFVSQNVIAGGEGGALIVFGKLTIKNHTRDIFIPFTTSSIKEGYIFKGDFKINRKDFKIGRSGIISESLAISLIVVARKIESIRL